MERAKERATAAEKAFGLGGQREVGMAQNLAVAWAAMMGLGKGPTWVVELAGQLELVMVGKLGEKLG